MAAGGVPKSRHNDCPDLRMRINNTMISSSSGALGHLQCAGLSIRFISELYRRVDETGEFEHMITEMRNTLTTTYRVLVRWLKQLSNLLRTTAGLLLVVALVVTLATVVHYLVTLTRWASIGLPLDDSWIHLEYARTIYEGTPWEYSPGRPSTGSTSPLWSIMLVPLFFITTDVTGLILGIYVISTVFYILCTFLAGLLVERHTKNPTYAAIGMIAFVLTPRVTWLMLSGMEFPLFLFILLSSVLVFERTERSDQYVVGILLGFAYRARPEGILLVGLGTLLWLIYLTGHEPYDQLLRSFAVVLLIAAVIILPWVIHCLSVTGYPLPDTFYAKLYPASPETIAVWNDYMIDWFRTQPFLLIGLVLGLFILKTARPYLWVYPVILLLMYRLIMPRQSLVNNARYLTPVLALCMVCAVIGVACLFDRISRGRISLPRMGELNFITIGIVVGLLIVPIVPLYERQSDLYGNAVKNINEMQVDIGLWLRDHTSQDAVIATHDVGAIRFISGRAIIDLAGLVSPEILHSNMTLLETLQYLRGQNCSYFAFFDELFTVYAQALGNHYSVLYTVHLDDNVICGRDTMSVYFVNWTEVPSL